MADDLIQEQELSEVDRDKVEREAAKERLRTVLERNYQLIRDLSTKLDSTLRSQVVGEAEKNMKAGKQSIAVLARKQKKASKSTSKNLVHPCYVTDSFSKYVAALKKDGKLGHFEEGSDIEVAIDSIINDGISSLLVTTLLISCDNYNHEKKKDVVFFVTPTMKKYLPADLARVKKERDAVIAAEAADRAANPDKYKDKNPRTPFVYENYGSALNNVIAAFLRDKAKSSSEEGKSKLSDQELAANLASLQKHLKAHNKTLRTKRS